ncbi:hypothetical protein [Myxococcus sp. Y35]|uniref:hypothetical protein n=1 Tax=Pseudomyxococcus flavus TaxID=3115648 RepID=UPI003CE68201
MRHSKLAAAGHRRGQRLDAVSIREWEECQGRVGKRAWLPFLGARRCFPSRQSLPDDLMTQRLDFG